MGKFFSVFFYGICCFSISEEMKTFRAAVYEHAVILPPERHLPVNRSEALENMMKNVVIYEKQVMLAAKQNVDIIVFPEDGIYGMGFTRKALEPYLEYVPDPTENWNACDYPDNYANTEIQNHLSCFAKTAELYLVANIGDRQPCSPDTDPKCPKDGHYQFNTNVVYNPKGDLIAKYHKINLFFEFQFDFQPDPKSVSFETPFGKFALFTCFDILFKNPAITSLMEKGVGNVVFPTAWMDAPPLLAAIEFHSAFAAGAKVNFLSANINFPLKRFHGSGIYSPTGYAKYQYTEQHNGTLLIADLPIRDTNNFQNKSDNQNQHVSIKHETLDSPFHSDVFHDRFTFIQLESEEGNITVCDKTFCCYLAYTRKTKSTEMFAFGAFDGLHTNEGVYYLQICTLLKCSSSNQSSCGTPTKDSQTKFSYIKMAGTFTTQFIYPEILLSDGGVLKLSYGNHWSYTNGTLESRNGFELPVVNVGLFSRDYERDISTMLNPSLFVLVVGVHVALVT